MRGKKMQEMSLRHLLGSVLDLILRPGNGASNSSATATKVLPWRLGILLATSLVCVGFSLEEERVMQHRSSKYFPQFENQGINPVGVSRQVSKVPSQKQQTCTQRYKGVVNPFMIDCKVRSEGGKCNTVKV